jgi:hypothetical protein
MSEAEDARHDTLPPRVGFKRTVDEAIAAAAERVDAECRAKALELAVPVFESAQARGVLGGATLYAIADDFAVYIRTGERPTR